MGASPTLTNTDTLGLVQLNDLADRYPNQLSGGQQQRVALARAIVIRPPVLLLDEPLGALDKLLRDSMQIELRQLQRKLGITTVFVTHDQEEALTMSDAVAVMNHGVIEQIDRPIDIYERPKTAFVASFLGVSNILEATVLELENGATIAESKGDQLRFTSTAAVGETVRLVLRPENIKLVDARDPTARTVGVVTDLIYKGSQTTIRIDRHGETLTAVAQGGSFAGLALAPGGMVGCTWNDESLVHVS